MKELKFIYDNKLINMEGKTHAALFRSFFDWWKEEDIIKTIYGLFHSNLRLSTEPVFERNVIKKNNYAVTEDLYVITHITPKTMDSGIIKFLASIGIDSIEVDKKVIEVPEEENEENKHKISQLNNEEELTRQLASELTNRPKNKRKFSMKELIDLKMQERDEYIRANSNLKNNESKNNDNNDNEVEIIVTEIKTPEEVE